MDKCAESRDAALAALDEQPPVVLLRSPIDYIFADHFRHRAFCKIIDDIAGDETADMQMIAAAIRFLETDFGPHVVDEEEGLFPLLRQRAAPEDRIEDVLGQLSQDHADDEKDAAAIVTGLAGILEARGEYPGGPAFRNLLAHFAAHERRHMTIENAIVLPLARARLKPEDLLDLGKRMAARRGAEFPKTDADAG